MNGRSDRKSTLRCDSPFGDEGLLDDTTVRITVSGRSVGAAYTIRNLTCVSMTGKVSEEIETTTRRRGLSGPLWGGSGGLCLVRLVIPNLSSLPTNRLCTKRLEKVYELYKIPC